MALNRAGNLLFVAVLLFALCLSGVLIGETGTEDNGSLEGIAFISLSKILNAHKGLMNAQKEINESGKNSEMEIARGQEEIDNLNNEIQVYSTGSKEFLEGKSEIERKELALKQKKRELFMEHDGKQCKVLKDAYIDIERAVRQYASERGLKAVFPYSSSIEKVEITHPKEYLEWVSLVKVVWYDERLDISDAIITIINGS